MSLGEGRPGAILFFSHILSRDVGLSWIFGRYLQIHFYGQKPGERQRFPHSQGGGSIEKWLARGFGEGEYIYIVKGGKT